MTFNNKNTLDMAMLITDAILNQFEKSGKLDIPLDEHKYSFDLQDVIQSELEKIANEDMIKDIKEKYEHLAEQLVGDDATDRYTHEELIAEVNRLKDIEEREHE